MLALLALLILPPPPAAAPGPPPAADHQRAATDHRRENKLLVRRYLTEVLAAGKTDELDRLVAKTFVDRTPGAPKLRGAAAVRQAQQKLHSLFSKLEYDPRELIAEDDRVAAHYLVTATVRTEEGVPESAPVVLDGVALFRIRGGKIQDVYVLNDQISFLRQLGYKLGSPDAAPAVPGSPPAGRPAPPSPPPPPGSRPPT